MAVAVNMWNEEKTEQLIQLYKQYPLLWDPLDKNYKNRHKKQEAIKNISTVVDINAVEVERKLNILITQFRRTHRKVLNLKKSGFKAEDVEKNVWYGYKSLLFLKDRFTHSALFRNSLSKGQNEQQKKPDLPPLQPKLQPATTVPAGTILRTGFQQAGRPNIVSGTHMNEPLLFMNSIPVKRPAEREKDEYDLYGEQIILKLRKMDEITRTETQHHINCILHEAEMKKLHEKYNIEPAAAVNVEYDEPSSPRDCDAESNQVVCDSGYTINIKTDNSVS